MTANQHPYPAHVRDAVADAIADLYSNSTTWEQIESADDQVADVALAALWEASQVDDVETIKTLPNDAVVRSDIGGEPYIPYNFIHAPYEEDYPAHVIWWGRTTMTANHAHTPTDYDMQEQFEAGAMVTGFSHSRNEATIGWQLWLQERDARIIAAAKVEAYREAQQIVAGDMTIEEQRGRRGADKVDAAYLIRELDQEIQELQEPGHE